MMHINFLVPPTVRVEQRTVTVEIGMSTTISCFATGNPNPTITWRKGNRKLDPNLRVFPSTLGNEVVSTVRITVSSITLNW